MYFRAKLFLIIVGLFILAPGVEPILARKGRQITYIPPRSERQEKPKSTESSANRGCRNNLANVITLIVPTNHIAQTVSSRPVLYYFLHQKETVEATLSLAEIDGKNAIVERSIKLDQPGINGIKLPPEVQLKVNQEYIWTITLICNKKRPSANREIQALIKRVAVPIKLFEQLKKITSSRERSQLYAQYGMWYDTLASLSFSKEGVEDLQKLLEQIGLPIELTKDSSIHEN